MKSHGTWDMRTPARFVRCSKESWDSRREITAADSESAIRTRAKQSPDSGSEDPRTGAFLSSWFGPPDQSRRLPLGRQLPQNILQNPAILVVQNLLRGIDPYRRRELRRLAQIGLCKHRQRLPI